VLKVFALLTFLFLSAHPQRAEAQSCACPAGFEPGTGGRVCTKLVTATPTTTPNPSEIVVGDEAKGANAGMHLKGPNFIAETTGSNSLPFAAAYSNYPVTDSRGIQLQGTQFDRTPWLPLIQGNTSVMIKGQRADSNGNEVFNTWYGKAFCLDLPAEDHYVVFVGGDNAYAVDIDGQRFAHCLTDYCFENGLFLGRTIPAGNHFIELKYKNYGGPGAIWFEVYQNSNDEVRTLPPNQLTRRFSSKSLQSTIDKKFYWDYDTKDGNICPAGFTFDTCKHQTCVKYENRSCLPLSMKINLAISCAEEGVVTVEAPFREPTPGTFTLQPLPAGAKLVSDAVTIPGGGSTPVRLAQVFPANTFKLVPGVEYQLSFVPQPGSSGIDIKPAPVKFKAGDTGCGRLTVTPSAPKCGEAVTVGISGVAPGVKFRYGLQEGSGTVAWEPWRQSSVPDQSAPVGAVFPGAKLESGKTYTVHLETENPSGIAWPAEKKSFTLPDNCGKLSVATESCGPGLSATVSGLPASSATTYRFGIEDASGSIRWIPAQTVTTAAIGPVNLYPQFPAGTLQAGKKYQVHYESRTAPLNTLVSETVSFDYPSAACATLDVTETSFACGDPIGAHYANSDLASLQGQWSLYALSSGGSRLSPALASVTKTYAAGQSWTGTLSELFGASALAALLVSDVTPKSFELTVTSTDVLTGRQSTQSKKFTIGRIETEVRITNQPRHPGGTGPLTPAGGIYSVYDQQDIEFTVFRSSGPVAPPAQVSWTLTDGRPSGGMSNPITSRYDRETASAVPIIARSVFENGCKSEARIELVVNRDGAPDVPNAFTPNGDGKNDLFRPLGNHVEWLSFRVFNRWGEIVYDYRGPGLPPGWDGRFKGQEQATAAFVWTGMWRPRASAGEGQLMKGTVVLIR
jgi:gliding motility-associated-like protein